MAETSLHRARLVQEAFRLEYLTLAWMVIEAGVAIGAGLAARSVTLLAFGIDSLIELVSAIVLIWRLTVELRTASPPPILSSGAPATSAACCCSRSPPTFWELLDGACGRVRVRSSRVLLVSLIAIPLMWIISRRKLRLADALGSRALRADAVESIACGWLSFVVVIGLLDQLALGAWWIDSVTSLVIVWLLVREGREAWNAEEDDD